ncbi:hypothetical protein M0812_27659 [Anaeramoeba flamelloides]|uniref:BTB domain-containing protein n=1 Tax=Anaeramoeba flamelloides TaxID=1746091 RepID=A0AAV7Y9E2_9EUKA|nr:hypothetical protein M0812_27659 [Anaeramoeba flamelloides]
MTSKDYLLGSKKYSFLVDPNCNFLPNITNLKKHNQIIDIIPCHNTLPKTVNCILQYSSSDFELFSSGLFRNKDQKKTKRKKVKEIEKEKEKIKIQSEKQRQIKRYKFQIDSSYKIKKILASNSNYLILTLLGHVYSLGNNNSSSILPFEDPINCLPYQLRIVSFFQKNDLFVEDIVCGEKNNYFLCSNGHLYGNGNNLYGQLALDCNTETQQVPRLLLKNIKKVFSGFSSKRFFFIKSNDNSLYGCGNHYNGALGIGKKNMNCYSPVKINSIETSDLLDLVSLKKHTIYITKKEGKIYSCGSSKFNGLGLKSYYFLEIPKLKNKKIIQISGGAKQTLVLTHKNEIYGWGFPNQKKYNFLKLDSKYPQKINFPNININDTFIKLSCGNKISFICQSKRNPIIEDFRQLLIKKQFSDFTFPNTKIKAHKLLLELRTGCEINHIEHAFQQYTKNQIKSFLLWLYTDDTTNFELISQIFTDLNIKFCNNENKLENDLRKLYNDPNSKDFSIIIENHNDKKKNTIIKVHKFILIARSGLFRSLFDFQPSILQIKEASKMSFNSMKLLIKFLYTEKIKIKSKYDPLLIVNELSDAIEYYQLNEWSSLSTQINEISQNIQNISNSVNNINKNDSNCCLQ